MNVRLLHGPLTSVPASPPDHPPGTRGGDELDEITKILERARRAGINPLRVIIALGLDQPKG